MGRRRMKGEQSAAVETEMVKVQTQMEIFSLGSHFCERHATWHINNWAAMSVTLNQKHTHEAKARETVGGGFWEAEKRGNTEQKGGVLWQP